MLEQTIEQIEHQIDYRGYYWHQFNSEELNQEELWPNINSHNRHMVDELRENGQLVIEKYADVDQELSLRGYLLDKRHYKLNNDELAIDGIDILIVRWPDNVAVQNEVNQVINMMIKEIEQ